MKQRPAVRQYSTVSSKGQTVIPADIRATLGIKKGMKLGWILRDGKLTVLPIPEDPVAASMGILKGYGTFDEWLAERNEERRRELQKEDEEEREWRATSSTPQQ